MHAAPNNTVAIHESQNLQRIRLTLSFTRERFVRYAVAAVCAFVAFDKVLSPQYLLWLIPLVPLVLGRRGLAATVLLTIACVLTQVWFPQRYFAYADDFELAWVVLLRDLVLVALLVVLVMPRLHDPGRSTTVQA